MGKAFGICRILRIPTIDIAAIAANAEGLARQWGIAGI
jgi:hypothetical protein